MIHAVTHGAIHSLCSCAGHMRNMISQHLPCPWKFLYFTQTSHPLPSCQCALGALLTESQVHDLVTALFPEWLSISQRTQRDRLDQKASSVSHVYHRSRLHGASGDAVVIPQLATAPLRGRQPDGS